VDDARTAAIREIEKEQSTLGTARTIWNMGMRRQAAAMVRQALADRSVDMDLERVLEALTTMFEGTPAAVPGTAVPRDPESELLAFRRAEFNILRNEVNDPDRVQNLRVIPTGIAAELSFWFERVNLVERLRETRVFYGFDRVQPATAPLPGMPDTAMRQLFRTQPGSVEERWLPAIEVFGEGIYLELREDPLTTWQQRNSAWLQARLDDAFVTRLNGISQALPPLGPATWEWASRFLLIHSLAHVLINELVFECGYSTASLRERLYVSSDSAAPMAGLLIYTAAGDSEGTLGGLVRLGRAERLGLVLMRALDRASWCSADPVCSEHLGGQGSRLANLAACHACVLLPETSCETINQGLDRAMVVGTPEKRDAGFLSNLLNTAFAF
jgi:hypothetical protein